MKLRKYVFYGALSAGLILLAAAIVIYPERYVQSTLTGILLWAECVLPSLFPFMVITLIFTKTGIADKASLPLKRVCTFFKLPPAASVCLIMSLVSGYPAGSKLVAEFCERGYIDKDGAKKLACLCSTSGPLFIIGSVGYKMFGDKIIGLKLFLAHALSVTVIALIISLLSKKNQTPYVKAAINGDNALYDSFYSAAISVIVAGGFIAFFYTVSQIAVDFRVLNPLKNLLATFFSPDVSEAVCKGLIEVTTGCRSLSKISSPYAAPLAGFLITFGGISIILQQLCYLTKAGVSSVKFILIKFIQAIACFLILLPMV